MTEQLAAEEVETAPQVDEPTEELANSEDQATEAPEAELTAEGVSDSYIPEDKMSEAVQKRINRLTWEKHEAERESAAKDAKIKELEQKLRELQPAAAPISQKPTLAQFDFDDEKYLEAIADWKLEQRMASQQAQQPAQPAQQQADPAIQQFQAKQVEYAQQNAEYTQLVNDPLVANAIAADSGVARYIISAENGPKLHHHLLNNAAELIRIKELPEWQQGAELAKIELKLNQVKQKNKSNAPEPVKPVSNGKSTASKPRSSKRFPF